MNYVDGIIAVYIAYAAVRGAKRGVAVEGYRLVRLAISFAVGCGVFPLLHRLSSAVLSSQTENAGGLGFVLGLVAAFFAMRALRSGLTALIQRKLGEKFARSGGAIAGGVRALAAASALAVFLHLAPWIPGRATVTESSLVGRAVGFFVSEPSAQEEQAP